MLNSATVNGDGSLYVVEAAQGLTGTSKPSYAIQVGGSDGINLQPISTNTSGQINVNNISGVVSLPTGAATSTNQATIIANQTNGTQTSVVTQPTASLLNATVTPASGATFSIAITGTVVANAPVYNDYTSTNITTGAYVQLVASTTNTINNIHIFDSSGQTMILAVGAPGSEVNQVYVQPGGDTFTLRIPAGSRISYKALTANATAGYLIMSFLE